MPPSINLANLGRRARAIRMSRRLTLEDVMRRAKFTVSWLSKLENGQLSPSLDGLVRLAEALECGVEDLVEGLLVRPRHVVVRKGSGRIDRGRESGAEARLEHLADSWRGRGMNPVMLHLAVGGDEGGQESPMSHDGERFLFVIAGEIDLSYGPESIQLAEGDSVYLDATIPHAIACRGRSKARVLSVAIDPSRNGFGGGAGSSRRRSSRRLADPG